jgi:hypothetical protein
MGSERLIPPSEASPEPEFSIPWTLDSVDGLWSFSDPAPYLPPYFSYVSGCDRVTEVYSRPLAEDEDPSTLAPSAIQVTFDSPLDLGASNELRFWLRSSLPAKGSEELPFYLVFEAFNSDHTWQRFLPIRQPHRWELHQLWLEDMEPELRSGVTTIRLSGLNPPVALDTGFTMVIGDVIGVIAEPVQDVEAALEERLTGFQIVEDTGSTEVSVIVEQPELNAAHTVPYILIIPWAIQTTGELGGSVELIDNYGYQESDIGRIAGAYVRPPLSQLQIDYAIDVYTQRRSQKSQLFDAILSRFSQRPFLLINGQRLPLLSFEPSPERMAEFASDGHRTPLFYRLTLPLETGDRQFAPHALHPVLPLGQRTPQPTDGGSRLESDPATTEEVPI